jgi:hypothetical protein
MPDAFDAIRPSVQNGFWEFRRARWPASEGRFDHSRCVGSQPNSNDCGAMLAHRPTTVTLARGHCT